MSRSLLFLALFVPLLPACKKDASYDEIAYPVMALSQPTLEFNSAAWGETVERTVVLSNDGGMPMGVKSIEIGPQMDGNFTVSYSRAEITCPDSAGDTGASAKGIDVDTGGTTGGGGGGGDSGSTTTGDDTGGGDVVAGALFVLDPGCQIPINVTFAPTEVVGDAYGALIVESNQAELTQAEEDAGKDLPAYLRDPLHWKQVVYLHGSADHSQGALVVRPRSYDFGYVDPDSASHEEPARLEVSNVGDGDITLGTIDPSSSCGDTFVITDSYTAGTTLGPGQTTLVEVAFAPTDTDAARCDLTINSNDPQNPAIEVALAGNTGTDPENVPPTVFIRTPEIGYKYNTIRPLRMELNIFDVNQPATSLVCRVKSAVLGGVTVADCDATDESGHVFVDIPAENFETGSDTLLVTVTDGSQASSSASISVVINSDYPADDDDGDGFGVAGDADGLNADCDDTNPATYPKAAEIYDGEDNDCDGTFDEGTVGYDDDEDGVAEIDGDCNDYDSDTYPSAPEKADGADNDCDGSVDEGTFLYDDDGDGYAEANNDCDDTDAAVNPTATESCDGIDNDCDGLKDSADGCVATDSDPLLIGKIIRTEQSACMTGDILTFDALAYDADGQTSTYQWTDDKDNGFDNAAAPVVNWTCPAVSGGGQNVNVYVVVRDPDGGQDWAFEKIEVYPADAKLYDPYRRLITDDSKGCSTTGGSPSSAAVLAIGAGLALVLRRRS